jgi:hypothetical protein
MNEAKPEVVEDLSVQITKARDDAEFWRICTLHLHRALMAIAGGGRLKPGGSLLSLRSARRLASVAIEEFRDGLAQEMDDRRNEASEPTPEPVVEAAP